MITFTSWLFLIILYFVGERSSVRPQLLYQFSVHHRFIQWIAFLSQIQVKEKVFKSQTIIKFPGQFSIDNLYTIFMLIFYKNKKLRYRGDKKICILEKQALLFVSRQSIWNSYVRNGYKIISIDEPITQPSKWMKGSFEKHVDMDEMFLF